MCYELLGSVVFGFPVTHAIVVAQYYSVSHLFAPLKSHMHCLCIANAGEPGFWVVVENSRIH